MSNTLKACNRYFYQVFIFSPNDDTSKNYEKCFLFHKKALLVLEIIKFFYFRPSLFFLPVGHCFRGRSKINLKVYDAISCLNKNSITYFVCYLEKEKRYDTKTLSIDGVSNKTFLWKNHAENMQQEIVPDLFIILVNNPKQPLHPRNSFKSKIF